MPTTRNHRSKRSAGAGAAAGGALEHETIVVKKTKPRDAEGGAGSAAALFYPFRALGYVTEGVPFATQRRGTETFVTVSAGNAWQIYNCDKLRLVLVGPQLRSEIRALAAKNDLTFAGVGNDIVVCRRAHRVCTFEGHAEAIVHLHCFGTKLISACAGGRVMAWDISRDALDHLDGHRSGEEND